MPDVYAAITEADAATVNRLGEVLELRAADPRQRAMLETYLAEVQFPNGARVLEVGCGTGPVSRRIAEWPRVGEVVGLDPSPYFVEKARDLSATTANLTFVEGDGRKMPFAAGEFDVVVFHTTLCHVPQPELALAEARRVLQSGGLVVVFDGDYATMTVANGEFDPLQTCYEATKAAVVYDPWFIRKVPSLLGAASFDLLSSRSHGYMRTSEPDYLIALVDRGADMLLMWNRIGDDLCAALKAEARRRVEAGSFFGFIGYASLIARKPD